MRGYEDGDQIPASLRVLLREWTGDQEVHADFWNSRNRVLGGRPRDVWHTQGGPQRVMALVRRKTRRPGD